MAAQISLLLNYYLKRVISFQIQSIPIPVSFTDGVIVPKRGWIIFGGHDGSDQTQQLQLIDGIWNFGDAVYKNGYDLCIVQVLKIQLKM